MSNQSTRLHRSAHHQQGQCCCHQLGQKQLQCRQLFSSARGQLYPWTGHYCSLQVQPTDCWGSTAHAGLYGAGQASSQPAQTKLSLQEINGLEPIESKSAESMNSTWDKRRADAILRKLSRLLTAVSLRPLIVISSTVRGRHLFTSRDVLSSANKLKLQIKTF